MPNVVGERFQITVDRKVREQLGVRPGDLAVEWVEDGRLVVAFLPPTDDSSMLGIVKRLTGRPVEPISDWDGLRDRAWRARSAEIGEALAGNGLEDPAALPEEAGS